jgi:ectoine hydroxylase
MLSQDQLMTFDREGYLFLPDCFVEEEAAILRSEAEAIYTTDRKEVWREKSGAPRTAFTAHTYDEAFRRLGAHPRLIKPVEQLLREAVYVHQFKINAKAPFDGELWQWHQDYGVCAREDGMPEPRAMNISVFLDEVMPFNGPLMLIPRSHKSGVLEAGQVAAGLSHGRSRRGCPPTGPPTRHGGAHRLRPERRGPRLHPPQAADRRDGRQLGRASRSSGARGIR